MIRSGLVSVTFRRMSPRQIVDLVSEAGLEAIEWGGDGHVPHGQVSTAREVASMTRDAGLAVAAYGSYYRVGVSEEQGLSFGAVLETAVALQAPVIRVWAGNRGSALADDAYWAAVVADSLRIADLAQAAGVAVAYEYHPNTLTDTKDAAQRLIGETSHANIWCYWQQPPGMEAEACRQELRAVLPRLSHLHVNWRPRTLQGSERRPLAEGADAWASFLRIAAGSGRDHAAMIEFVHGDTPAQFLEDAEVLKRLLPVS